MNRRALPVAVALLGAAVPAVAQAVVQAPMGSLGSLALVVTTDRTTVTSGADVRATMVVRSTGTEAATGVGACLAPPPQLTVARAEGAQRKGRRVCFSMGDLPAGTEQSRTITLRAVAGRTVNVRLAAGASSTCRCSARPSALSPVIRIVRAPAKPRVTG